jgi:phosphatidylinositol-3-phosphatase
VVVTWDEGASSASCCQHAKGGRIATVVVAESLHGVRHDQPVDHAGILRTIEDVYGLPPLGDAACACSGNLHPLL